MKKIVLKQFEAKEPGNYQVYLGNDRRITFTSKRDLIAFIRTSNKFISQKAFDIHIIYMDVWQEYQRCWFYFGSGEPTSYTLHHQDQRRCDELLRACEERLTYALKQDDWYRGSPFAFGNLTKAVSHLESVIDTLVPLYKTRSQTSDLYRMNAFYQRLTDLDTRINNYAKEIPSIQITTQLKHHA